MSRAFFRQLSAEQKKSRHRRTALIPLGFFLFELVWTIWQLGSAPKSELATGYLMLFYQLPILNTILFPVMISVIASRLCDMEVMGDTFKLLYTLQERSIFFCCKYLAGIKYIALFSLGHAVMITLLGKAWHFKNALSLSMLLSYLAVTFSVSSVLYVIQQTLSLLSSSQIMPHVVGIAGSFLGLFSLFFPKPVARLFIWGYLSAFPCVRMDWDVQTRISKFYEIPFPVLGFLAFLLAGAIIYAICKFLVVKKEV